jgi:hypothetical protein
LPTPNRSPTSATTPSSPATSPPASNPRPTVSRWKLKLPQSRIPFIRLVCETEAPLFKRAPVVIEQVPDERGDLYPVVRSQPAEWVRAPGDKPRSLALQLNGVTSTDQLFLEFDNGDNPPIELRNIQLCYWVSRVLFKPPTGSQIFLYYGNPNASAPRYDLDLVARQMLAAEKGRATLGPEESLKKGGWHDTDHASGTGSWIFWGVLAAVVVVLLIVVAKLLPPSSGKSD